MLSYEYNGLEDDHLSRPGHLKIGTDYCQYGYLGLNTFLTVLYDFKTTLNYMEINYGTDTLYSGLDRFGRVVDMPWSGYRDPGASSSSGAEPPALVHLQ